MNVIAALEAELYRLGIGFVHLTATDEQRALAQARFGAEVTAANMLGNSIAQFSVAPGALTGEGATGQSFVHVPILVLEGAINPEVDFEAVRSIPTTAEVRGDQHGPVIIRVP